MRIIKSLLMWTTDSFDFDDSTKAVGRVWGYDIPVLNFSSAFNESPSLFEGQVVSIEKIRLTPLNSDSESSKPSTPHIDQLSDSCLVGSKRVGSPKRFTPMQRALLDAWFIQNIKSPYPQECEITSLCSSTGLSRRQVQIFFTNKRARTKKVHRTQKRVNV